MWLRRLVALSMIIALFGMNGLVLAGLLGKPKDSTASSGGVSLSTTQSVAAPTIVLSVDPTTIPAGTTSAIKWTTTGSPTSCTASDGWDGSKTPNGAESTGRVANQGDRTYTLECTNEGGAAKVSATLHVGPAGTAAVAAPTATTPSTTTPTVTYCGGRLPCYGPKDIAAHGSSGNCWGWNGDRVLNITGYDASYHKAKSGISSIEVGGVCGKDLSPALNDSVKADNRSWNHKSTTKSNSDRSMIPYFIGYYDASK